VARLKALLKGASRTLPVRVLLRFIADGGPSYAIVIAWNALFALFPITLTLATIAGFLLGRAGLGSYSVISTLIAIIPNDANAQEQALAALNAIQRQTGVLAVVALVGFLWAASGLFGAMEDAFDHIFRCPRRDFLRQKLMSLAMMAIFTVLALAAVGTAALLPFVRSLPFVPGQLQEGSEAMVLQVIVGVLSGFVLFFVLYLVVPNRRLHPRSVWPGAVLAGLAFEALGYVFPLYARLNGGINRYGRTFALLFVLMLFFYLVGVITVVGAELNAELARPRKGEATDGTIGRS
jgi:membrane protein